MPQRAYTLLGDDVLLSVRRLLEPVVRTWCADWGGAYDELGLVCRRAWDGEAQLPPPQWQQSWQAGAGLLMLAWPAEMPGQVQRLLFGVERQYTAQSGVPHSAQAAGMAAWHDLLEQLAAAALPGGEAAAAATPPAPVWRYASGALLVQLQLGRHSTQLLLNDAAVQALLAQLTTRGLLVRAPDAPLAPVDLPRLLAAQPVALPVALGQAAVDLGSLVRLQVGDVIRLDRAADRALPVNSPSGIALFDGYLGRSGDVMALELLVHDFNDGVKYEQ